MLINVAIFMATADNTQLKSQFSIAIASSIESVCKCVYVNSCSITCLIMSEISQLNNDNLHICTHTHTHMQKAQLSLLEKLLSFSFALYIYYGT